MCLECIAHRIQMYMAHKMPNVIRNLGFIVRVWKDFVSGCHDRVTRCVCDKRKWYPMNPFGKRLYGQSDVC